MKKFPKLLLPVITLLFLFSHIAQGMTNPIYLPGSTIAPGQQYNLVLNTLPVGVTAMYYNISCYLTNPNYSLAYPVVLKIWGNNATEITINGQDLKRFQAKLSQLSTSFEVKNAWVSQDQNGVITPTTVYFQNLDPTDAVVLENCIATPGG